MSNQISKGVFVDRVGYCIISRDDGQFYQLGGDGSIPLDFKFSVEKKAGAIQCFANVSICGLKKEDILKYTSFMAKWREFNKKKFISIFAGYESAGGAIEIFKGDVFHATPTRPPDIWLNMQARTGHYEQMVVASKSILEPLPLPDVCENAVNWMGRKLLWMVQDEQTNKIIIDQFQCSNSMKDIPDQLQELAPDRIIVNEDMNTGTIQIVDKDNIKTQMQMMLVSKDTGLLDVPKPSPWGVEFEMRLCPTIKRFQVIHLESQLMPLLNGEYAVATYTHTGHLRGHEWKTKVKARRIDIYNHGRK